MFIVQCWSMVRCYKVIPNDIEWPPKTYATYHRSVTLPPNMGPEYACPSEPPFGVWGERNFWQPAKAKPPNMQTAFHGQGGTSLFIQCLTSEKYLKRRKLSRCQRPIKLVKYLRRWSIGSRVANMWTSDQFVWCTVWHCVIFVPCSVQPAHTWY